MQYYQARQRKSDGRWDWTGMHDKVVTARPPCSDHEDGHATAEEAERHFYDYEVENLKPVKLRDEMRRCSFPGCLDFTQDGFESRYLGLQMLCIGHCTKLGWVAAHPFKPGITVAASW